MLREKLGPRFVPEALFIVGVAIVAMLLELPIPAAIGLTLTAWLLVVVAELAFARRRSGTTGPTPQSATVAESPATVAEVPEEPAPTEAAPAAVPVVEPEPEVEVEEEPEHEPEPNVVERRPAEPREWNVWELERRARERAGVDTARDEEWGYLLLYLREFASPEGTLPRDFDPLVRESFPELIETP